MRVDVAGISGSWSTEQLCSALGSMGVQSQVIELKDCVFDVTANTLFFHEHRLDDLQGVIVKKLGDSLDPLMPARVNLLKQLEYQGVRVFSPARAIEDTNDRYKMTQRLAQAHIPLPRTVVTEAIDFAEDVIMDWGRVVVKPIFTSKGRGMVLLGEDQSFRLALRRWQRQFQMPFYIQEYVPNPGRDIAVAVLAGQVIGAYYRVNRGHEWLTTTSAGGRYEHCSVNEEMVEISLRVSHVLGLDFTVVDLVESPEGYRVYEASAFGGFAGLWKTQQLDVARLYADFAVQELQRYVQ